VAPLAVPPPRASARDGGGVEYLLIDDQLRAAPPVEHHRHVALHVTSAGGVEEASEIRIDFDPSYQRLVLHGAWVLRGGRRIPVLSPGDVHVVQRETDLDRQLFEGTFTAVLYLPDVRRGDVVEYAYTLRGANPVLAGRYADELPLSWDVPVDRLRVRLLWPDGRALRQRVDGLPLTPTTIRRGGETEYVWERHDVPASEDEDRLPPGVEADPALELSEFGSWGEVVRWAQRLYPDAPLDPAMEAELAGWRRLPGEAEKARAALRFVQDEVRYLGLEQGEASHRPHPPAEVFASRFGDCKDKAYLLVTLLRALGIEAAPALVDTERQGSVARHLPSPYQFDHVIVRARVDGRIHWLEPTRSFERAPLDALVPPVYGVALPIAAGVEDLEPLPPPAEAPCTAVTTFRLDRVGAPASLEVVTTLTGLRALSMRQLLAGDGIAEQEDASLQHRAQLYPGLSRDGPLEIEDAPDRDRLVLTERYRLPPAAAGSEQDFTTALVGEELEPPRTTVRKHPLQVAHPVRLGEEIRVVLPGPPGVPTERREVTTPAANLTRRLRSEENTLVAEYEYRSLKDTAAPGELARHLAGLRAMRQLSGFTVTIGAGAEAARRSDADGPAPAGGAGNAAQALGILAAIGLSMAIGYSARAPGAVGGLLARGRGWLRRRPE
jgi:transglutaminase-like putative cysteine protease